MHAEKANYMHRTSKGCFYYIYRCCGAEFSTLRCLTSDKWKTFRKLEPPSRPAKWFQKDGQWRLKCRGKTWTRCDHCRALFLYFTGRHAHHTKEKCPHWQSEHLKQTTTDNDAPPVPPVPPVLPPGPVVKQCPRCNIPFGHNITERFYHCGKKNISYKILFRCYNGLVYQNHIT